MTNVLEYCYNGEWRRICSPRDSQWDTDITMAACAQLGYSDSGGKLAFVITVDKQIEVAP